MLNIFTSKHKKLPPSDRLTTHGHCVVLLGTAADPGLAAG